MACETRGFLTLRRNTLFSKASLKYVVFKRFAEIRGSSAQPSVCFVLWFRI